MTTQQRVSNYRAKSILNDEKIIEVKLSRYDVSILDALASNSGVSRILFVSSVLRDVIMNSGYFISGDKLLRLK